MKGRGRVPDFMTVVDGLSEEVKALVLTNSETGERCTPYELYVICLLLKAGRDGNMQAIKELGERLLGRVLQTMALTGADGEPLLDLQEIAKEQLKAFLDRASGATA